MHRLPAELPQNDMYIVVEVTRAQLLSDLTLQDNMNRIGSSKTTHSEKLATCYFIVKLTMRNMKDLLERRVGDKSGDY